MPERHLRLPAVLFLLFAFLGGPALAAENSMGGSGQALPADLSPEQAELAKKYLESNPEARKALEAAQQQKEQEAREGVKPGGENAEGGKKDLAPGAEGAAVAAKEDRFAAPRYDWRKSPYVFRLFGSRLKDEEKRHLVHFGHDLFAPRADVAVVLENMPAVPGHVIGPGDEVVVRMWGRMEGTQRLTVDRDGKIFFPKFGSFYVAGKTFEELKAFLKEKVSGIKEVSSDVSLGRMKGVRVSVKPGMTVGSLLKDAMDFLPETYFDYALLTRLVPPGGDAGGRPGPDGGWPDPPGDLERAEVVRVDENRTYRTIYFPLGRAVAGDPEESLLLSNEDHIQIHSIMETRFKKTVMAAGEVNNAGEYVLTDGMRLSDLLFKAGGFRESAYTKEAEVIRREISPQGDLVRTLALVVLPEKALRGEAGADIPLKERDLPVVRQIPDWSENIRVMLAGEVQFPGISTPPTRGSG
jgi:protein involved in polysaccharide export with SLBB domain